MVKLQPRAGILPCQDQGVGEDVTEAEFATAQCRSRQNSFEQAMTAVQTAVDTAAERCYNSNIASNRKQQVGSGMRGDKIRTYRFQDDRVQDHLTGLSAKCSTVLKGNFDLLWPKKM